VVAADHLFGEGAFRPLLSASAPACLVDEAPSSEAWDEGTRVRIRDGRARAFGKGIDEPAIDCGAFLLTPTVFEAHREAMAGGDASLAGAISALAARQPLTVVPLPKGCWWYDVDTPQDLKAARVQLRRSLVTRADGPVSRYLNRPVSTRMSMILAPLRPSPDLVSVLVAALGVLAAWLLAAGEGLAGGLLAQAVSVLDGVDGELARLQIRASPRGALLDGVLDRVVDVALVGALGVVGTARRDHSPNRGGVGRCSGCGLGHIDGDEGSGLGSGSTAWARTGHRIPSRGTGRQAPADRALRRAPPTGLRARSDGDWGLAVRSRSSDRGPPQVPPLAPKVVARVGRLPTCNLTSVARIRTSSARSSDATCRTEP